MKLKFFSLLSFTILLMNLNTAKAQSQNSETSAPSNEEQKPQAQEQEAKESQEEIINSRQVPVQQVQEEGKQEEKQAEGNVEEKIVEVEEESKLPEAGAETKLEAETPEKQKSPFRNSLFTYENAFSAYSLKKDSQLTYNPYYVMSYSIRPRYYIWKELYVGLRWDLEQELTNADDTTKKYQVMWSDFLIDLNWNKAATIPIVSVVFNPKVRFELPASLASQAKTMYLSIGPGFDFMKAFDVWGGIIIQWAFRYTKYFYQYTGSLYEEPQLECSESGSCQYDVIGPQNPSMRFSNVFYLEVRPLPQLSLSGTVEIRNYILYKVPEAQIETMAGTVNLPSSGSTHSAYMWYIFDISYDVLPYLTLSLGTSTYNPQLNPSSEYYPPFFNRFTNIYFDITVDIDGLVHAFGKNKGGVKSATERL